MNSKDQSTEPTPVPQAPGLNTGEKALDLRGGDTIVTKGDAEQEEPAIRVFLDLLGADIQTGHHLQLLPKELAEVMLANLGRAVNPAEDIEGEVVL